MPVTPETVEHLKQTVEGTDTLAVPFARRHDTSVETARCVIHSSNAATVAAAMSGDDFDATRELVRVLTECDKIINPPTPTWSNPEPDPGNV